MLQGNDSIQKQVTLIIFVKSFVNSVACASPRLNAGEWQDLIN